MTPRPRKEAQKKSKRELAPTDAQLWCSRCRKAWPLRGDSIDCPQCKHMRRVDILRQHFGFMAGYKTRGRFEHQVPEAVWKTLVQLGWVRRWHSAHGWALEVTPAGLDALRSL